MKKTQKKLQLKKEVIARLNNESMAEIRGGVFANNVNFAGEANYNGFTSGCTDGCTSTMSIVSAFNCSKTNCTADCLTKTMCMTKRNYDKDCTPSPKKK